MDDDVLNEVRNYIDREGNNLRGLLDILRTSFEIYGQSPEGKGRLPYLLSGRETEWR